MSFDAKQKKIYDVLSGDFKYIIPRYQRKYVWEEKQWRELLEDLKYCLEADKKINDCFDKEPATEWSHFLGSFVFEKIKKSKNMMVIDGQQRLTTITIMLCALCVLLNEYGEKDRFRGIVKYIIGTDDLGADFTRVYNSPLDNFEFIIAGATKYSDSNNKENLHNGSFYKTAPKDNVKIKQCFKFFYNQFKEIAEVEANKVDYISKIKDKIIGLDVIEIIAENEQESYNIFEILNARGVDLKQHELIKNYIFKYIQPQAQIDTAKRIWEDVENTLFINRDSQIEQFFKHYVAHKFEKATPGNTEFRILKYNYKRTQMDENLNDILSKAKIYSWFYNPDQCDNEIIRSTLYFFKNSSQRQFRPVFLSVISAYRTERLSQSLAEKFFMFMENFYFAYNIVCGGKSNVIDDIIYDHA